MQFGHKQLVVAMLAKPGRRSHAIPENPGRFDQLDYDNDNDNDNDNDANNIPESTCLAY